MNGAESLVHTLLNNDVRVCFANPGTSEMHFVSALDRIEGMRTVSCLAEGVVTGAADGYGRMLNSPAATLLHCGPGLANGIANLHNAKRASTPLVNLVGDQASYHVALDPPLASDTAALALTISAWVRTSADAQSVGRDAADAIQASRKAPGSVATLILPSDVCWSPGGVVAGKFAVPCAPEIEEKAVEGAAQALFSGLPAVLLLSGAALRERPLALAAAICDKTGARLFAPSQIARAERGRGRHAVVRLPYAIDQAVESLAGTKQLVLVGAQAPVTFFAYPGKPGVPTPPDAVIHKLAEPGQDSVDALERLADRLGVYPIPAVSKVISMGVPRDAPTSQSVAQALSTLLPENAIVVDESVSFGRSFFTGTENAAPHDWLQLTGGAIGSGMPLATGASLGAPGRRVVNLQADGSGLYTVQALWTQARESLDVTTVILANRKYAILLGELQSVGAAIGKTALDMMSLHPPVIDWVRLAKSFGVEGESTNDMTRFADLFTFANSRRGPFLIELLIG